MFDFIMPKRLPIGALFKHRLFTSLIFALSALLVLAGWSPLGADPPVEEKKEPPSALRILKAPEGRVTGVAYSPDGTTLAGTVKSDSVSICLWDARTGQLKHQMHREGHQPFRIAFSPDGRWLASSGKSVALWEVATSRLCWEREQKWQQSGKPRREIYLWMTFSPDGRSVLAATAAQLQEWDVSNGRLIRSWPPGVGNGETVPEPPPPSELYTSWALSPDGRTMASGRLYGGLVLWDRFSGKEREWLIPKPTQKISDISRLCFSSNGDILAECEGQAYSRIRLWDVAGKKELPPIERPNSTGGFGLLGFSPNGRLIACQDRDEDLKDQIVLYEIATGQVRCRLTRRARAVAFSPDGGELALTDDTSGKYPREVAIWRFHGSPEAELHQPVETVVQAAWDDLAELDGQTAHQAIAQLIVHFEPAIDLMKEHLRPVSPPDPKQLETLIKNLTHPRFQVREQSQQELIKLGPRATAQLKKALQEKSDLEFRRRAEAVLRKAYPISSERLRALRAIEALEQISTPSARAVLRKLAESGSDGPEVEAARDAMSRLMSR